MEETLLGLKYRYPLLLFIYFCFVFMYLQKPIRLHNFHFIVYYSISMAIWLLYYVVVFSGVNSRIDNGYFAGTSMQFVNISLVYPIVYFTINDIYEFYKSYLIFSIIVLMLFIISILTSIEMVMFNQINRGFVDANRYLLQNGFIILFLLPLFISNLLSDVKMSKLVLIGGILVIVYILLTISRRQILSIIEYFVIISLLYKYIYSRHLEIFIFKVFKLRIVILFIITLSSGYILFPSYLNNAKSSINNLFNVIVAPASASRHDVERISFFKKAGIVEAIKNNLFVGTGESPEWGTGSGGSNEWEGSDYIFLACFAMYGAFGLLLFLPFYILVIVMITRIIKIYRHIHLNKGEISNSKLLILAVAVSAFFIRYMLEYPNWFFPIGAIITNGVFFVFFGVLAGIYYLSQKEYKRIIGTAF